MLSPGAESHKGPAETLLQLHGGCIGYKVVCNCVEGPNSGIKGSQEQVDSQGGVKVAHVIGCLQHRCRSDVGAGLEDPNTEMPSLQTEHSPDTD